uniref:Radial spoke head 10 homolog B n=1 Tax=Sinocyclocheilus anshuiensis TaxID=1608454 RepID=A0A671MUG7_9TELE
MHGPVEYIWSDGLKYQGDFKLNVPMGRGTYTWPDGSTYEGEVHKGVRHGVGMYKCAKTSNVYRGQWYLGKRQGQGVMYYNQAATSCYPSGNLYEGQWKNNVRHGEGTMRWAQLNRQYCGQWVNGIQVCHLLILPLFLGAPCSQYPRMNEYTGEFIQGMRHGQGQFLYASGAVYFGKWKHDKKHGQGMYTFENGRVYEGEFIHSWPECALIGQLCDWPNSSSVVYLCTLGDSSNRASQSSTNSIPLGSDMVLNIQTLLSRFPEAHRDQEFKQVLRHIGLLREIYSFYSCLGHEQSSDIIFPLTHLQFSRFLMDCKVHKHGITLAQMDRLLNDEVHSPFTAILPRVYQLYYNSCLSKLMRQNIIPNAKHLKGREIKISDPALTSCSQDLCLYDTELTVSEVLEILSVDSPAIYDGTYSNLDLEMSFLEFFEALLGCAEVKGQRIQTDVESQTDTNHQEDTVPSSLQVCAVSPKSFGILEVNFYYKHFHFFFFFLITQKL